MKLSELVSKHLWGCAVGWGTKEQKADIEFQKQWCNCGILEARAEYAAQQSAQADRAGECNCRHDWPAAEIGTDCPNCWQMISPRR